MPTGPFTQLLSSDFVFDAEPVDVVRLQQRVFTLEQENLSKDVLIGTLDGQIKELQSDNRTLKENLGNLTAMFLDLKGRLQYQFGKAFEDKQTPATTRPVNSSTPTSSRPSSSTAPTSNQSDTYTVPLTNPSSRPLHPLAEETFQETRAQTLEHQENMRMFFETGLNPDQIRERHRKFIEGRKRKEVMIVRDLNMAEPPRGGYCIEL